jgi:outer membrane protein OmpA-like peptidoglycan-associated protein
VKAVKFETGKAILKPESSKILSDIADILLRYPDYNLRVEGHTDSQGKDAANQTLSEKRAQACADFLTAKGIAKPRLSAQGFGETKPVADNKTAAGRTKNRRVEFDLVLPEKK